jgi:hemolysin activation/secretion protein
MRTIMRTERKIFSQASLYLMILFALFNAQIVADMFISCASAASEEPERGVTLKAKEPDIPESIQQQQRPGDVRPALPEFRPKLFPEIVIPPYMRPPESRDKLSAGLRVFVKKVVFSGNAALNDSELGKIAAPYENKTITSEELEELRQKLTMAYVDRGYINSGAVIPDQKITDGIITITIIEGKLTDIEITGTEYVRPSYIRKRIELAAAIPFNINVLQERLLLVQEDPLIRMINAELVPGVKPGEAVLKVKVEENTQYQLGVQVSNNRSPSVGGFHGELFGVLKNITGWGDSIGVRYGRGTDFASDGGYDLSLSYNLPLNAYNTALRVYYDYQKAYVIEAPFKDLDITSTLETFGVSIIQPVYKTLANDVKLTLALETRRSNSFLLGEPFSFTEGVENGLSKVTVLRFAQEWQYRSKVQVFALRSQFSWGMNALGSTINDNGTDGRFVNWLLQVQWARLFEQLNNTQLIFRTDVQLSKDPLLAMEKFSMGGATTVRGYRESLIVRDQAVVSSLEARIPIFRLPLPVLSKGPTDGTVHLAPFFDWGWAENKDRPTMDPRTISSVGFGLRWEPSPNIQAYCYYGYALRNVDLPHEDIQDKGIHFLVSVRFF